MFPPLVHSSFIKNVDNADRKVNVNAARVTVCTSASWGYGGGGGGRTVKVAGVPAPSRPAR